ncbi:Rieske (2Fe-2S) protein [Chitinispirillum alkaliphilum]|nr:Rieske (2Fe-2S) protein [Chitinispirillum alkaliphilum]
MISRRSFIHDVLSLLGVVWFGYAAWHLKNIFSFRPQSHKVPIGSIEELKKREITYFRSHDFYVINDKEGLYAISALCTHRNCVLLVDDKSFSCPCHGAQFTLCGEVIRGPAQENLRHYHIATFGRGALIADLSKPVEKTFRYKG